MPCGAFARRGIRRHRPLRRRDRLSWSRPATWFRRARADLVSSAVAMAVSTGAPRPDVASEGALRDAVRAAKRIGYSTGPSGTRSSTCSSIGTARARWDRLVQAPPGVPVAHAHQRDGDAELGFQQLSELLHEHGIDVIGSMPPGTEIVTTFSAGCRRVIDRDRRRARRWSNPALASRCRSRAQARHATGDEASHSLFFSVTARNRHDHRLPRPLHHRAEGAGGLAQPPDRRHRRPGADAQGVGPAASATTSCANPSRATSCA